MKWETGIFSPGQYIANSNTSWILEDNRNPKWTRAENKLFENALAVYDTDTPDRWQKVAAMIPGKTVSDVMKQYKQLEDDVCNIEAGLVSVPDYYATTPSSSFTLDCWANSSSGHDPSQGFHGKRSSSGRPSENERKKGIPWTEEEHKLFLLGLKKHGKGDWRNISRNFVLTRTPTQVASHAQKYFIRQLSGGKDKRRASIHDITTVNLTETSITPRDATKKSSSSSPPQNPMNMMLSNSQAQQQNSGVSRTQFQWTHQPMAALSNPAYDEVFLSDIYGIGDDLSSFGFRMQDQNLHTGALHHHESSSYLGPHHSQNMVFQMP
ncbi:transcription factor DIVARICATA-like [Prosopis cineraria]|uniref:transcription factor DIVARICATA-like n=1 Tax=Prosopis cineraria TaxID=364024 RepID=UPI00240F7DF5|nr:transcription factor DIVARICATA-like [Prosopis cineraria]